MRLARVALLIMFGVLMTGGADARDRAPAGARDGWHYAKGCYTFRDRLTCSRYCYRDRNGHRYCHERAWLARPSGDDRTMHGHRDVVRPAK